jgi:endoglucanase
MRVRRSVALCMLAVVPGAFGQFRRGVNVAGAEFGQTNIPGTFNRDYTFNSENTFRYFGEKKLGLIRLPFLWERLQPVPGGPLDAAYLAGLKQDVGWARAHGAEVILDVHNFARYSFLEGGALKTYVIDNAAADGTIRISAADLADLWVRLSNEFKFETAVYAYDLMNEPHDMGKASWKTISQQVLDAVRANQDDKLVLIPGDGWSSGNRWLTTHGPNSWIHDPANNFAYEAHQYFDRDESGTYALSYDSELARTPDLATIGRTRIAHFTGWCRANAVRGVVDEFGIPASDPRWAAVMDDFLAALDAAGMDGAYWAAGEWWGSYALSVQPAANFTQDKPQMATLQAHAPGGYLTALSAASISVARATAGSLVTVRGAGFAGRAEQATVVPYPLSLADVTVMVTDASGASAPAGLLYASETQLNIQMPESIGLGRATISVSRSGQLVASGTIQVASTGPAIFTANAAGYGVPAAHVVRVKPDGSQVWELAAAGPIAFGGDRLFLVLYGTGVRAGSAAVQVGASELTPYYAGPQGQYPGLDQIVVELPRSLPGAGAIGVTVRSEGVAANGVAITFQ